MAQKTEVGWIGATRAGTRTVTLEISPVVSRSGPVISNDEPTWRPNVLAVCVLITTWITGSFVSCLSWLAGVPSPAFADGAGLATGKRPPTSRICCALNGWRSVTSILTGVPPVPGMVLGSMLSPVVMSDTSVPEGPRLTTPRLKSPYSWSPTSEISGGVTVGGGPRVLTVVRASCTALQVDWTVMVLDSGGLAAIVERTACVLVASASRAPAVDANTANSVSSANQMYMPRTGRLLMRLPPRGVRPPGRGGGR